MPALSRVHAFSVSTLAALVLLGGCSSQTPAPGESSVPVDGPTASAEPDLLVGTEFSLLDTPHPLSADVRYTTFAAGGALWAVDPTAPTTLHWTSNGVDWTTTDLTASGLPAEARFSAGDTYCPWRPVVDDRGDGFTVIYHTFNNSHPQGLLQSLWLVDIESGAVKVTQGAAVGLETMPAPEGGLAFRTSCAYSFVELDGQRALVGQGQWWEPYRTGNVSVFVATEGAAGMWSVHSTRASAFLGGEEPVPVLGAVNVGDELVAIVQEYVDAEQSFGVWTSTNGRDWSRVTDAFDGAAAAPGRVVDMQATPHGIALVAAMSDEADGAALWSSPDGKEWTSADVEGAKIFETGSVLAVGGRYMVGFWAFDEASRTEVWELNEAGEWVLRPDSDQFSSRMTSAVALRNGLIEVHDGKVHVSGDPWS